MKKEKNEGKGNGTNYYKMTFVQSKEEIYGGMKIVPCGITGRSINTFTGMGVHIDNESDNTNKNRICELLNYINSEKGDIRNIYKLIDLEKHTLITEYTTIELEKVTYHLEKLKYSSKIYPLDKILDIISVGKTIIIETKDQDAVIVVKCEE